MSWTTRTTLLAALAVVLTATSLHAVYEGPGWLPEVLGVVLAVAATGLVSRRARVPLLLQPLVGAASVALYVVVVHGRHTLALGLLPTGRTVTGLGALLGQGLLDVDEYAAPVATTPGLVLLAVLGVGAVAVLVDLLAVGLRRPALAGLPLLTLLGVCSGTVADGVGWWPFALGAGGWLALLLSDSSDRVGGWGTPLGPQRPARSALPDQTSLGRAGRRIGLAALGTALIVPALVPGLEGRVLGGGDGWGAGSRSTVVYNPLTDLGGQLRLPEPRPLLVYKTTDPDPDYLRLTTLDQFDDATGWSSSKLSADLRSDQVSRGIPVPPALRTAQVQPLTTVIRLQELGGPWLPVPATPTEVDLDGPWLWDEKSETVFSTRTRAEQVEQDFQVTAQRAVPEPAALRRSGTRPADIEALAAPPSVSPYVRELTDRVTADAATAYDEVVALQAFFRDPANGFEYSEDTDVPGIDAPNALEAFLRGKQGFCEQYASAMAAMVRLRGIPARVGVGFTSGTPDDEGTYQVTTSEAHAWPEVWFPATGWIRFEPTPRTDQVDTPGYTDPADGADDPAAPAAPTAAPSAAPVPTQDPAAAEAERRRLEQEAAVAGSSSPGSGPGSRLGLAALVVAGAGLVLSVPAAVAAVRRRRRWSEAGPLTAWEQLREDALDLGHRWHAADSPRAAAARLVEERSLEQSAADAARRLALAMERARYARPGAGSADAAALRGDVAAVRAGLLAAAPRRARWTARLLPASTLRWAGSAVGTATADVLDWLDDRVVGVARRLRRAA
jgi:hypothetical protein